MSLDFAVDLLFYLILGLGSLGVRSLNRLIRGRNMGEYLGEAASALPEKQIRRNLQTAISRLLYGLTLLLSGDYRRDGFLILAGILSLIDSFFYLRGKEYRKETVAVYEQGIRLNGKYHYWRTLKLNRVAPEALEFTVGSIDYHCSVAEGFPVQRIGWI